LPGHLAGETIRGARQGFLRGRLPHPTSGKQVLPLTFLGADVKKKLSRLGNPIQKDKAKSKLLLPINFCSMVGMLHEASATKKATKKSQSAYSLASRCPHFMQGR